MTAQRLTHDQREQAVLDDLEKYFPGFAGHSHTWTKVPDGQDPPDFVAQTPSGAVGLEFIEWLDGDQMRPAKGRESQRANIARVVGDNWQNEQLPQNVSLAVLLPIWNIRIARNDEAALKLEFYRCVDAVDSVWLSNPARIGSTYYQADLSGYPTLARYFEGIRYIGGEQHGFCWIDVEEDKGKYDPSATVQTLEQALDKKLTLYSTPEKQAELNALGLAELDLLVHGGINAFRYNTPAHPLSLEQIASQGAEFYTRHPQRHIFDRVWFFDSLNSADDLNALIGLPPGSGDVKWLAGLWPTFEVYRQGGHQRESNDDHQ